jgi:hypothetical protein
VVRYSCRYLGIHFVYQLVHLDVNWMMPKLIFSVHSIQFILKSVVLPQEMSSNILYAVYLLTDSFIRCISVPTSLTPETLTGALNYSVIHKNVSH